MILVTIGLIFIGILFGWFYIFTYWKRKGFSYLKPNLLSGSLESFVKKENSFTVAAAKLYTKSKEPFVGIYLFIQPALLIRDANLVQRILVSDFQSFHDRGLYNNEKIDPLSANLFSAEGTLWRNLRGNLTPIFTSGKLKAMFTNIEVIGKRMIDCITKQIESGNHVIEMNDLATKYATDIIVSIFFGLEVNSFVKENHIFTYVINDISGKGFLRNIANAFNFLCPKLYVLLKLYKVNDFIFKSMKDVVQHTIKCRKENNSERKDFVQLLMQMMDEGNNKTTQSGDNKSFTLNQIVAQTIIFLAAGLESIASTISFCVYELTQNEDIMEKLQRDIAESLKKHNNVINYDSIQDMKYLDLVIKETLRLYPPMPILNRKCTKAFKIPDSNLTIEEGTPIVISILGLHRDPQYFENPEMFHPERFLKGNEVLDTNAYIPYGDGPRACIGTRQGKLSVKAAIARLLINFDLKKINTYTIEFDNYNIGLIPKGGVHVAATRKSVCI